MIALNMDMPKGCEAGRWQCPCYNGEFDTCQGVVPHRELHTGHNYGDTYDDYWNNRPEWCPLVEVDVETTEETVVEIEVIAEEDGNA